MKTILFLDNWMIEKQVCLERVWGKPTFVKEVFNHLHPRVNGYGGYSSLFWDERVGKYVMYQRVSAQDGDAGAFVLRLESDDPYNWANPTYDADVTPVWKGFKNVPVDEHGERFWPIYINSLQGTPLAERGYLMSTYHPNRQVRQSILAFSEDGIHFDLSQSRVWQPTRADTWCGWLWNAQGGFYQIHTRPVHVDRRIAIITTRDFEHFEKAITVLQPDAFDQPGTEFYSMPTDAYEDIYIGMLHVFSTDLFEDKRRVKMNGRMDTHLTYSYNGLTWYRTAREAFVPTRDYGLLGGGQIYIHETLRTRDNRLLFMGHASVNEHYAFSEQQKLGLDTRGSYGTLLYEMRLDGFCSLKTWGKDGLLRTKTVIPQSGELSLNVRTTRHTVVRVQLLDGNTGEPIPGYTLDEANPISGDHLFAQPTWQGHADVSELIGKPIRIEIMMREAELFAIRIPCQVYIGTEPTDTL